MYGRYKQQNENNSDKGISDSSRPEFSAVWGSGFQTNPIMPEPCLFIIASCHDARSSVPLKPRGLP
jgi:hypothetical protein